MSSDRHSLTGYTPRVHIDLSALAHNYSVVRSLCPDSRIMAAVKADAYGHGLLPVARTLSMADGFAVARPHEALSLRQAGIRQRILLLATWLDTTVLAMCARDRIDITVHDIHSLQLVREHSGSCLNVWLKLDSGMHRAGLAPDAFVEADRLLRDHASVGELIHMTHFASSDGETDQEVSLQIQSLASCHAVNTDAPVSMANSAAIIRFPETRTEWVRPGIMLYGGRPFVGDSPNLLPVMQLQASILGIRTISAGERVGYGGVWTAARTSRIALVGVGYADGYPRHAPSGTPVLINGVRAPLVGRVSMDAIGVDVTDCDAECGDVVTLWGGALPACTVADSAATIDHTLFTGVTSRVQRHYTRANANEPGPRTCGTGIA